jgi:hypothetical protein
VSKISSRRGGPEGLVDHVDRSQTKKAKRAWILVGLVTGVLTMVIGSDYMHPILAALLGVVIGFALGGLVALWIWIWPIVRVIWWWLPETLATGGLVTGWNELAHHTTLLIRLIVVATVVGIPAAIPPLRQAVTNVAWCFIGRHRIRVAFTQYIITNRYDTDPLILWARPTKAGVRVWLMLRAGISVDDLQAHTKRMAGTCWVNEATIERASEKNAAFIHIDLKRRNALAEPNTSPVLDHIDPNRPLLDGDTPTALPDKVNLSDVTDSDVTSNQPADTTPVDKPKPSRRNGTPKPGFATPGGDDISDWL